MSFWPFRRKPVEVSLDDESLDRAIRAGVQFPLNWFLAQTPEVQETIALHREFWIEDLTVAAGYILANPEHARLALAAEDGDEDAEAALTELTAKSIAEQMGIRAAGGDPTAQSRPTGPTMGGVGKRRREAAEKREAGRRKGDLSAFGASKKEAAS